MVKKQKKEELLVETPLDEALMNSFSVKIEKAINSVIKIHPKQDSRVELLTILLSFGAQVAQDMEIEKEDFEYLATTVFQEADDSLEDEEPELVSDLIPTEKPTKTPNNKLN